MYGLKQLALLSFMLLSVSATQDTTRTMVGIETTETSKAMDVLLDDCHEVEQDEVLTISVKKYCRVFTGPECTGRNSLLPPGDHSNTDPVPIESIYCHAKRPY
ncbi:hypothetical protein N7454_011005 [Penicillium verhagenii]|uniref:uncharacterized protein n=1 Tax=Penicillium verhagenii TaxID=1562060 RepID=UPI002544E237|nr:uncharacterized protein N7466_007160 [Penicillium verhagenii]KAJ5915864.1 hypothetical protein N7454_011005 [Penicillium verhagenii]KAJ5928204.1 hypothetical protein N7466_007160 [Penicillium verhagenii]